MIIMKTISSITWVLFVSNFAFSSAFLRHQQLFYQRWHERQLAGADNTDDSPKTQYFVQKLDHFDPTNEETWLQRYWNVAKHHQKGGPAFLLINGEWQASQDFNDGFQWKKYVQKFNATFFSLEHRFYGRSVPNNDTSTENLVHLSSQQALADIANFIRGVTNQYNISADTKWIVFGCSYAGTLAAWVRLKYPHLVHGAVSSSAPLLAKADFPEYFQVAKESLDFYKPNCSAKVAEANKELDRLIKSEEGRGQIRELFNLCHKVDNNMESISTVFETVLYIAGYIQNNLKEGIEKFCNIMTSSDGSALQLYAEANALEMKSNGQKCLDNDYKNNIELLNHTDANNPNDFVRQWIYQTCTEFGWYQTINKSSDSLGADIPVEYFIKRCENIYGLKYNDSLLENGVHETNTFYGGFQINVGNIVFIHGSIDPWHAAGITRAEEPNALYQTIYIKGAGHCGDVYGSDKSDSDDMKNAREKIVTILQSWLQN
ncbi:putative serine protease K12H4.7 [Planococcus citri]|uniref:putative serine protease K12H4.7 n=1 Tax=Planococcus citri TaxID=170843 RepID=UPI0031F78B09